MTWEKGRRRNRKQTAHGRPTWMLAPGPPLVRPYRGDVLVSASVGPAGDLVALWANAADNAALRSVGHHPTGLGDIP
ncbi:hypothetical protein [Micromonospora kangleipakensis]|nr:hypothetical protein [Micromonospora kangleipakensis]